VLTLNSFNKIPRQITAKSCKIRNPGATRLTRKERTNFVALELNTNPINPWLGKPEMPEEEEQPLTLGQHLRPNDVD